MILLIEMGCVHCANGFISCLLNLSFVFIFHSFMSPNLDDSMKLSDVKKTFPEFFIFVLNVIQLSK